MSTRTQGSLNPTLTNYAKGIAQDRASAVAEFIAPTVAVGASIGQFKKFDDKNAFQVIDASLPDGADPKRIEFGVTDGTFNCRPYALEVRITKPELDAIGDNDPLDLQQAKIDTLISSAILTHEEAVLAKVKASLAPVSGKGVWSNASNDPVVELDEQIMAIAVETGLMPNAILMGIGAWNVFRNHPKVIARMPGAALIGVTTAQASAFLLNPGLEIRVGVISKDTAKFGKDKSAVNIVGNEVFVFHRSANPTTYDPSFAKTFRVNGSGIEAVYSYDAPNGLYQGHIVYWSVDVQVVSAACGRRLTIT
jgi:hypothetical protein